MYIVDVVPLDRRARTLATLSYFTALDLTPGDLVRVPFRSSTIPAVVLSIRPVSEVRAEVRQAPFRIKRLAARTSRPWLLPALIAAAHDHARERVTTPAAVLSAVISRPLLEAAPAFAARPLASLHPVHHPPMPECVAAPTKERERMWRTLTREFFARRASLLILCPSVDDVERLAASIGAGSPEYVIALHHELPKRVMRERIARVAHEPHPLALVVTVGFLGIPRHDIGIVGVEQEASPAYRLPFRPSMDVVQFAERYAAHLHARHIRADLPLAVISWARTRSPAPTAELIGSHRIPISFPPPRIISPPPPPAHASRRDRALHALLSPEVCDAVRQTTTQGGRVVLFALRKGLAPLTVCDDCGAPLRCEACGATMTTHRKQDRTFLLCHACGAMAPAPSSCPQCQSWRLTSLGVATQRVAGALRALVGDLPITILDAHTTPHAAEARTAVQTFLTTRGSVLIGTTRLFTFLHHPVEQAILVSFDALLALPHWNTTERAVSIMISLMERSRAPLIVQTRLPQDLSIFRAISHGALRPWYEDELRQRAALGYPPHTTLIRLTTCGSYRQVDEMRNTILRQFASYSIGVSPLLQRSATRVCVHCYLRLPAEQWPDNALLAQLQRLPPSVAIEVNPVAILS